MPDLTADPSLGLVSPAWRDRGPYVLPLGSVDRPREQRRDTLTVDLRGARGHLAVVGGPRSGTSTLLRAAVAGLALTTTPLETQVLALGFDGGTVAALRDLHHVAGVATRAEPEVVSRVLGEVSGDYLLDHLTSAHGAVPALTDLAAHLEERLPGPGVTPPQLRDRSWWTGPEVFVLVDDYDLVATARDSPVLALEHLVAQSRDVGLHLVLARRSGGASRALHEPVLQSLRDLAMPGLLLAGSPDEGPLLGALRPGPGPPGRARLLTRDRGAEVVQLAWCSQDDRWDAREDARRDARENARENAVAETEEDDGPVLRRNPADTLRQPARHGTPAS